jgi:hypothetical protein
MRARNAADAQEGRSKKIQSIVQVCTSSPPISQKKFTPYFQDTYRPSPFLPCAEFQHICASCSTNERTLCPSATLGLVS